MRLRFRLLQLSLMALLSAAGLGGTSAQAIVHPTTSVAALSNPILFVTQMPIAADFATIGAVFANHHADMQSVGRGGDLWIRYPDGTLKNLTAAAGYGSSGLQGANAIAVRDGAFRFGMCRVQCYFLLCSYEQDVHAEQWLLFAAALSFLV